MPSARVEPWPILRLAPFRLDESPPAVGFQEPTTGYCHQGPSRPPYVGGKCYGAKDDCVKGIAQPGIGDELRKNHYGSRSQRGTEVAALFYSLIESAKLCGVDPKAYLWTAARTALADRTAVTLPHDLLQ